MFWKKAEEKEAPMSSMSSERKQVLDLLAQGKITAEDAERLLDKLERGNGPAEDRDPREESGPRAGTTLTDEPAQSAARKRARYFRIVVNDKGDRVNIRIPLFFVRAGLKLTTVMPPHARRRLEEKGIDLSNLSSLNGEELEDALREVTIDVAGEDGETVRIFCE